MLKDVTLHFKGRETNCNLKYKIWNLKGVMVLFQSYHIFVRTSINSHSIIKLIELLFIFKHFDSCQYSKESVVFIKRGNQIIFESLMGVHLYVSSFPFQFTN